MRRSAKVILSVAAAMGMSARAQSGDPCEPGSFNPGACKVAVQHHGYCSGGWVPMNYSQKYPYYYDAHQRYLSGGGSGAVLPLENCSRPATHAAMHTTTTHGFGAIGSGHHVHAGG